MNIDYAMHIDCDLENAGVSSPETTESSLEPFDGMLIRWFNRDPVGEGLERGYLHICNAVFFNPFKNHFYCSHSTSEETLQRNLQQFFS